MLVRLLINVVHCELLSNIYRIKCRALRIGDYRSYCVHLMFLTGNPFLIIIIIIVQCESVVKVKQIRICVISAKKYNCGAVC